MLHKRAKRFASNMEKMSAGRMRIIVDAPDRHKAPLGIFDMVRSGAYEIGHTASYYCKDKVPATTFFTTNSVWYEFDRDECLVLLWRWIEITEMGGWFRKEIYSIQDLKGLKMRIPGHAGEVVGRAACDLLINKDRFDVLPEDLRVIIGVAAKEASLDMLSESFFRNTIMVWEGMKKWH